MRSLVLALLPLLTGCGTSHPVVAHGDAAVASATNPTTSTELPTPGLAPLPSEGERAVVPGFQGATAWLNVDRPLTLDDLKGRVVVVDFWTSCCINCIHTLPILHALEQRFAGKPFVVIGVHSPKFTVEEEADRLKAISAAYDIHHPIAVDGKMAIWKGWHAQSWPTVAILDVDGHAVWSDTGEPDLAEMTGIIQSALDEGRVKHKLASGPPAGIREPTKQDTPLAFPGKVIALSDGSLAIADTGHNRIVITDASGKVRDVIGSGLAGKLDGAFAQASFHKPQGIAQKGDVLYVADTENHAIRAIDRKARTVSTIAGTGQLGHEPLGADERPATSVELRSPWDVLVLGDRLYVALAGSHQIAAIDLKKKVLWRFAGSGRERRVDGAPANAAFAQPSGLATDGTSLFVLDSETSSLRAIDLKTAITRTVIGVDLFVFGDIDGDAKTARLQHPIGITYSNGAIVIADSYNSKIKRVDPATGETHTLAGGKGLLSEPAGLTTLGDGTLLVADTNRSRLAKVAKDGSITTLDLIDLTAPTSGVSLAAADTDTDDTSPTASVTWKIAPGRSSPVKLVWRLPEGTAINEEAPVKITWSKTEGPLSLPPERKLVGKDAQTSVELPIDAKSAGEGTLEGKLSLVICDAITHRVCVPVKRRLHATVSVSPGAGSSESVIELPAAR